MAVISCHECHQPVSTRAATCPHCGCPAGSTEAIYIGPSEPAQKPKDLSKPVDCFMCGGAASRACSQCGQFCCSLHISAPSHHHLAMCTRCREARTRVSYWLAVPIIFLILFFAWLQYNSMVQNRRAKEQPVHIPIDFFKHKPFDPRNP